MPKKVISNMQMHFSSICMMNTIEAISYVICRFHKPTLTI